jgi:membrane-bound lytic murein transglycosylase B
MSFSILSKLAVALSALSIVACASIDANATASSRKAEAQPRKVSTQQQETGEFANFAQWTEVSEFIDQMVAKHGFDRTQLQATLGKVEFVDRAIQLMKPAPPGRPKNWQAYRARFIDPIRVSAGAAFWDEHLQALARAEAHYGVPAEIIVGIIGVETVYGRNTGSFRVMDAVTTLGFAYPDTPNRVARMNYFRGELENTLLFARESSIDPFSLLGSYAGAIGWPQFMPGSIRKFAVDFDNDGKIDLRNSPVDAIGSVANFLVQHGWKRGDPTAFPVTVASDNKRWEEFIGQGLEAKFTLDELKDAGVTPDTETPSDMPYGLIDLQNGLEPTEYWLATNNFFAITKYNRSYFYAMSVIDLGREVSMARSR